ncbi:extracellular solute-binding protein [Sinorhizobium medicae]|uniref:Extracellular solute-binding protein n=1 Tax=Sinorhizobium medicae TaxID=110321 RepID=A0A6G1WEV1_9HYPH|nr:extracellular solute-binding protein [Sinorhizobium medicae]MQW68165.1 extracellular solute-binding protein [Sinorhizobium medicae]MQX81803.1 extracellular solute-binding protein [Sinorhizobium medicae]WQO85065.1 extracellular solute-binding protein [Sinorhizobium medicae]
MKSMLKKGLLAAALMASTAPAAMAQECADADRVPITWSTIAGFYTDAMAELVSGFEAGHCVKVNVVNIDNSQLYNKQVIEMVGQTGAYDVVTLETSEKAEFAENGFILPMTEYFADKKAQLDDVAPTLAALTTQYKGDVWGLPYYTYTAGYIYRADLFDDPTEKEAFKKRFNYDLAVPTTWAQHRDIAEFFTRKAGETLKGEKLTKDFYGVGLMAGPFPEIQDEMSGVLWSQGADWLTDEGKVPVDAVEKAMNDYLELVKYAPPAALTVTYDGVMNQMKDGQIAQTYSFFLDQWPNAVQTETSVAGAKMGVAEAPEKKAYIGGFLLAVSASSAHPKEAMDFVAHIGGHDAQMEFAKAGGTSTLMSVLSDPAFAAPESRGKTGHFSTLLEIFDSMKGFRSNLFDTPFGAKIYNTMQIPLQSAAAGQISARQAAERLAVEVEKICGGPCPIGK